MFEQAKKHAPCIIFIDEIDAVGRHRGAGLGGGHDEREQTLNQLLVEMDGFEGGEGVIVIAATNRPDVLDPALLRPGRFDRQVVVSLPDVKGREQILKVHMRKVPLDADVDAMTIARGTPGFSGADLANLVNEAALFAARESAKDVRMEHFDKARDKILMGTERRSMAMSETEKTLTAYHEAGHAIVGRSVPEHDPVYKVTIIPRGRALGVTMYLPEGDKYSYNKVAIESQLCSLYGGRVAEELIFGADKVTTGASNDIERATKMARNMVTKWGLSDELGPIAYGEEEDEVFLGRSVTQQQERFRRYRAQDRRGRAHDPGPRLCAHQGDPDREPRQAAHHGRGAAGLRDDRRHPDRRRDGRSPPGSARGLGQDRPHLQGRRRRRRRPDRRGRTADLRCRDRGNPNRRPAQAGLFSSAPRHMFDSRYQTKPYLPGIHTCLIAAPRSPHVRHLPNPRLRRPPAALDRPRIMGIVNVTPDSFSRWRPARPASTRPSRMRWRWPRRAPTCSTSAANRRVRARRRSTSRKSFGG